MYVRDEKHVLLIVASLASFLVPYTVSSLSIALPAIGEAFTLDAVTLGWVTSAYLLTATVCIVPFGTLSDMYGRKTIFTLGNALFCAGSLLAAISWSGPVILLARVVQGVGGSMVFSTSIAILTSVFPPGERGRAIGIVTATVYSGLTLGPFLGGILTHNFGWQSIFLVNVPIGILVLLLTTRYIPGEWKEGGGRGFDSVGSVLYGLMLSGCMFGLTLLPSATGFAFIALGAAVFYGFVWWERRQGNPLIRPAIFRNNPAFLYSNLAALINYAVVFAVGFLMSLYLQYNKGIDPQTTGLILVAQPVIQTIVSPIAGQLSDRIEPRIIATIGMAISTAGVASLALLSPETPITVTIASLAILGLGYGLFSSPNTNAIMSSVAHQDLGIASGMVSTMRAIGQMTSLAIAMMVFSVVIGSVPITPAVYPQLQLSVTVAFTIFTALGLAGIWASFTRGKILHPAVEMRDDHLAR